MHVFLSADSFVTLVAAVAEGFKNEVGGILFGDEFPSVGKMLVKQVIPLQTAKRGYSSVEFHPERTYRVLELWDNLAIHWPLGWFHSHPEYGGVTYEPVPTEGDKEFMDPSEIMIIVSIKEAIRRDELGYCKEAKRVSGAVGKYHIEIAAWSLDEADEVEEAEVWCPYIDMVRLGHKAGIVSRHGALFDFDTRVGIRDMRKITRLVLKYEKFVFNNLGDYGAAPIRNEILKVLKRIQAENNV